jgi:glycerol-3-phosphate dehydrogenase
MISEGEIVDAIHRKAGATTVNGIKRRVRPGAGRCQGGFCGPRVMEILARELGTHMEQVIMEEKGSLILMGSTRP